VPARLSPGRIIRKSIKVVADEIGVSPDTVRQARARAEAEATASSEAEDTTGNALDGVCRPR
jgi:hypothetical protein